MLNEDILSRLRSGHNSSESWRVKPAADDPIQPWRNKLRVLDRLKGKIKRLSTLLTSEELKSVMALTVLEPPAGARYRVGDTIHTSGVGSVLGKFKVYGIKAGGYGFAYIVLHEETLTPYCLKSIRHQYDDDAERVELFKREAEAWIRLGKHPNLIYAHTVLEIGGRPHILFEYAAGSDLWRQIKNGPLPIRTALKYAIQFCRGMVYAQSEFPGFVHGDVKPNNCLLSHDGTLKISDFGEADVSREPADSSKVPALEDSQHPSDQILDAPIRHWRVGTPPYMAPEQFDQLNKIDVRTDVYAFGIMLFEMLTGSRPFKGNRHHECFEEHKTIIPPDPVSINAEIPLKLAALILRCLAKSPAERPANFRVLERELSSLLSDGYQEVVPAAACGEQTTEDLIDRGISLITLDHYDEALACFDNLLTSSPQSARLWSHKGDVFSGLHRYEAALDCYDRALKLDPRSASAWASKGTTLNTVERYREALTCFDQALRLDARLAFVWSNKGQVLSLLGDLPESLKCLQRAAAIDSQHFQTHLQLGIVLSKLGRETEAISAYVQAITLNSQEAEAHYELANAYSRAAWLREAIESYDQTLRIERDHGEARSRMAEACRHFYSTSSQFVSEAYADELIDFLLGDQNDPDLVVTDAVDFLQLSDFDPEVFYLCANRIYDAVESASQKQWTMLTNALSKIRKNTDPDRHDKRYFYKFGKVYYGLDNYDDCIEIFQQSLLMFGPDKKAYYYIAACHEMKADLEPALDFYRQALALDPHAFLTQSGIKRVKNQLASLAAPQVDAVMQPQNELPLRAEQL